MFNKLKNIFAAKNIDVTVSPETDVEVATVSLEEDQPLRETYPASIEASPAFNSTAVEDLSEEDPDYLLNSPEVCGWLSTEEQEQLFSALLLFYDPANSILDVGCGRCDLYDYIKDSFEVDTINYKGIDFNPNIINIAKQKYPDVNAEAVDLFDFKDETFDWVVASGAFNLKDYENMYEYVERAIDEMYQKANIGVAFNLLTEIPDELTEEEKDILIDYDLGFWTNLLYKKYEKIIMRADYLKGDATFFIFK